MAFVQYLTFDGESLSLPDSYEVELSEVEADSGGETEAGTIQRDVVRHGRRSCLPMPSRPRSWCSILIRRR